MDKSSEQDEVLVTGGSGYLAGSIIIHLLVAGRPVRTTIRDLARADEVRATLQRHAPTDRLRFHAADLLADPGWDAAVEGVRHVIHVASPMPVREYRTQDLEKPAREGVRRVLEAAHRAGVRRVVMTSSTVAATLAEPGTASDETVWTDVSKTVSPYTRSKTLAEQDAWALARTWGDGTTLTTILPGFVQGPALGPAVSGSLELPLRMLTGRLPLVPRVSFCGVDTRDVAELHIRALTDDRASGERVIAAGSPL
ncbi:NAD-dependent epimerase/dehydratase family protein [uncultured Sphingomonas sp.]|uniref:NAD-dependent epimerase/dehydratase family protein n=1 Tax=uncultured Sphingomonas sp. TaxID=158754 RepID=UPI0035C98659